MISEPKDILYALANNSRVVIIDKASIANALTGGYSSLWRATGQPGQGAIPTAAAACDKSLVGSFQWPNVVAPMKTYIGWANLGNSNTGMTVEIHDRLAHIGGLALNVTTAQAAVLNPSALGVSAARIGEANYSEVQWWLENYSDGGSTAANATITVTYNDGSTGALSALAVGGTLRASRALPLNSLIPAAKSGLYIAAISSVTLSASTGTAGNFGFTATRQRTSCPLPMAGFPQNFDWAALGLPDVPNDACLFAIELCGTTSTGALRGSAKLSQG